jgi:hypothetical protein
MARLPRIPARRLLAIAVLQLAAGAAHACLFARDTQPEHWHAWASALFAADVTNVEQDRQKSLDVITVRVVETFKGPEGAVATLKVPSRLWASCRLELPAVGARVLVALNPNSDALLVPLTSAYTELLRAHRRKAE